MDNVEFYKPLDKVEAKSLKKVNKLIELSKIDYKNKLQADIRKKYFNNANYVVESSVTSTVTRKLFDSIDEINTLMFKDVGQQYYDIGIKQVEKFYENESKKIIKEKYTNEIFETMLAGFILGRGLNYTYTQEIERRMDYYNTQMVNTSMAIINKKVQALTQEEINKNYKTTVEKSLDLNDPLMATNLKTQKRGLGGFVDATAVYIATKSISKALSDNGIKYSIRHAEVDGRTCDYCLEKDGDIYEVGKEEGISHQNCRCFYEPYSDEEEK